MEDDDARQLRLYKEMYLPDGDLYSDNKGRTRQFRWRNLGKSGVNFTKIALTRVVVRQILVVGNKHNNFNVRRGRADQQN